MERGVDFKHVVLHEIFEKDYFDIGINLYAVIAVENGIYYVQLGHKTYKYKKYCTALKKYSEYLLSSLIVKETYHGY